jgi:hypothetical protein
MSSLAAALRAQTQPESSRNIPMSNFLKRFIITQKGKNLLVFLCGVALSAGISGLVGNVIKVSEVVIVILTVLIVLTAIYFFDRSNAQVELAANAICTTVPQQIQTLAITMSTAVHEQIQILSDRTSTAVHYVQELYEVQEGIPFKGSVYNELERLVNEEGEILSLATTVFNGRTYQAAEYPSRTRYLQAIEEIIKRKADNGFRYVRILQIPHDGADAPITHYLDEATRNHCYKTLLLERQSHAPKLNLCTCPLTCRSYHAGLGCSLPTGQVLRP